MKLELTKYAENSMVVARSMAIALDERGLVDEATGRFTRNNPDNADGWRAAASVDLRLGCYHRALPRVERALLNPMDEDARTIRDNA